MVILVLINQVEDEPEQEGEDDAVKIDVLTLFPAMFAGPLDESIVQRARRYSRCQVSVPMVREPA